MRLAWALVLAACGTSTTKPSTGSDGDRLASYLRDLQAVDEEARLREVETWKLDEPTFRRIVVAPYDTLYADYAQAFDEAMLLERIAPPATFAVRPHYAGDPGLSASQTRLRWALPVQYPALVVSGIDTVFVTDGDHFRALSGLDQAAMARIHTLDATCAALLDRITRAKSCADAGWEVADAALRGDAPRFAHACRLATNLCPE